jgi:hypothetical protein
MKKYKKRYSNSKHHSKSFKDVYGDWTGKIFFGSINVKNKGLTSLKGCPKIIKGNFDCSYNKLKTLKYGPEIVEGHYDCHHNILKTLKNGPKEVYTNFDCSNNKLRNIKFHPKIGLSFYATFNNITNLDDLIVNPECKYYNFGFNKIKKLPKQLDKFKIENFIINHNQLNSLKNMPYTNHFNADDNNIMSLKYSIKEIDVLILTNNHISSLKYLKENIPYINLSSNNIKSLLYIPKKINELILEFNELVEVDYLPSEMNYLSLAKNKIEKFSKTNIPYKIKGDLNISNNNLTSFKNFPSFIDGRLNVSGNKIKNFKYAPKQITEAFYIEFNAITSVEDYSTKTDGLNLSNNNIEYAEFNEPLFEKLNMEKCNLKEIYINFFCKIVSLNNNRIEKLNVNANAINIKNNRLTSLKNLNFVNYVDLNCESPKDIENLNRLFNDEKEIKNLLLKQNIKNATIEVNEEFQKIIKKFIRLNDLSLSLDKEIRKDLLITKLKD